MATGLITPYIMLRPLSAPLTFPASDPTHAFQVRLSVMLLFVGGAVPIAIAITSWPIVRQRSYALAVWLIALSIANFSLQSVENAGWMSLFTLSQDYAAANAANGNVYEIVGAAVRAGWKWIHYTHLLILVGWMLILFVVLWHSGLVNRILAGLGVFTAVLHITGITLPQFLAYPSPVPIAMGMPLGFVYLALSMWLIVKGFAEGDGSIKTPQVELSHAKP